MGREWELFDHPLTYGMCATLCVATLYMVLRQGRPLWDGALMRGMMWGTFFLLGGAIMSPRWKEVNHPSDTVRHERTGIVLSTPVAKPKTEMIRVLVGEPTRHHGIQNRTCILYLQRDSTATSSPLTAGDTIRFCTQLETPSDSAFFGGRDYGNYLLVQHIDGVAYVPTNRYARTSSHVASPSLGTVHRLLITSERCKQRILRHIAPLELSQEEYALIAAMTLGEKSFLTRATKEEYAATGASHVLALSGMHLSILIMLLRLLIPGRWRRGHRTRWVCNGILILITCGYVMLTGAPLSLQRAAGMLILNLLLVPSYRTRPKADTINTLMVTLFILLCIDPISLFDVGLQLSVSAIAGIVLFVNYLTIDSIKHPWIKVLTSIPATCIAAQLTTAPLVAYYFHTFPTYFLVTGLWIALLSITLLPTLWTVILSASFPWLSDKILCILRVTLHLHNSILHTIAQWPHAILRISIDHAWQVGIAYGAVFAALLLLRFRSIKAMRRREEVTEKMKWEKKGWKESPTKPPHSMNNRT